MLLTDEMFGSNQSLESVDVIRRGKGSPGVAAAQVESRGSCESYVDGRPLLALGNHL